MPFGVEKTSGTHRYGYRIHARIDIAVLLMGIKFNLGQLECQQQKAALFRGKTGLIDFLGEPLKQGGGLGRLAHKHL